MSCVDGWVEMVCLPVKRQLDVHTLHLLAFYYYVCVCVFSVSIISFVMYVFVSILMFGFAFEAPSSVRQRVERQTDRQAVSLSP